MASSSSSPPPPPPKGKYDVFLSFRVDDKDPYTSIFHAALLAKNIKTYADDRLERGKTVPPGLMQAIKNSKISVIIFSDNYASATWILVLRRILGGMKYKGQIIKSLSYYEDRSHVQERPGTFGQFIERFKQSSKGVSYNTG